MRYDEPMLRECVFITAGPITGPSTKMFAWGGAF
jgi:hypothetical protein